MYRAAFAATVLLLTALTPATVDAQGPCPPPPPNPFSPGSTTHTMFEFVRTAYMATCGLYDDVVAFVDAVVAFLLFVMSEAVDMLQDVVNDLADVVDALIDLVLDLIAPLLDFLQAICYALLGGPPHPVCDAIP